jgi:hypothetical protein
MTNKTVRFLDGTFKLRGMDVDLTNLQLPITQGYKVGVRGGYVFVDGNAVEGYPNRSIKVYVEGPDSIEPVVDAGPAAAINETDAEVLARLMERFMMLTEMTKAVKRGDVRALIVSGPPGVGKSHGIEEVLKRHDLVQSLTGAVKYETVKGAVSPLGLYCKLYQLASKDNVIVFDDCDTIFTDETSLNLLKAALDSKETRTLHWNSDSNKLRAESIPSSFEFQGSAIFVTNVKFNKVRGRLREHIIALESRCHYIDLTIDTDREKMLLIKQIVSEGEMLRSHKLSDEVVADIVEFVDLNKSRLRELSLRSVLKIADLAKAFPTMWEAMAENTVMHRD